MKFKVFASSLCLAVLLVVCVPGVHAQANDTQLQSQAQKALQAKRFRDIHVSVQNGTITLTGTVEYFSDKLNAEKKVKKVDGAARIDNKIEVGGPEIPDAKLGEKVNNQIQNSRVGYGTTAFNAITVSIQNGVITLGGFAYGPVDASTAFNIAANTRGVKGVINNIHVDPPSLMDNRIRRMEYRAIYGAAQLNKYALNPLKPIRIQVENGHVTLYGTVDTEADKTVAGIRANTVPGVFSVTNNLHVANQEH